MKSLSYVFIAYTVLWGLVCCYLVNLSCKLHKMSKRLKELEEKRTS